jgi:hypothetical protein
MIQKSRISFYVGMALICALAILETGEIKGA